MPAEDLGTWPNIVEIGKKELELGIIEDWNIDRGEEEREILNK